MFESLVRRLNGRSTLVLALSLVTAMVTGPVSSAAARSVETSWSAKQRSDGKIQLTIRRERHNHRWTSSESFKLAELQGLTPSQVDGSRSDVAFELVRDAGRM